MNPPPAEAGRQFLGLKILVSFLFRLVQMGKMVEINKSKWKPKEKADLVIGVSHMCFGLAGLLLVGDLFSLFVTGNFRLKRFVVDISFIVWGILGRYVAAHYRRGFSSK